MAEESIMKWYLGFGFLAAVMQYVILDQFPLACGLFVGVATVAASQILGVSPKVNLSDICYVSIMGISYPIAYFVIFAPIAAIEFDEPNARFFSSNALLAATASGCLLGLAGVIGLRLYFKVCPGALAVALVAANVLIAAQLALPDPYGSAYVLTFCLVMTGAASQWSTQSESPAARR